MTTKNLIFLIYFVIVIIVCAWIFHPPLAIIGMTALIGGLSFIGKVFLSFDQSDKKELHWFKIIVMIIINFLALNFLKMGIELLGDNPLRLSAPGIRMLFFTLFFLTIGMDIYILYSYIFEKNKTALL